MPNHTCCVPGCFNRSSREKHLKFYRIPKDCDDRKVYLVRIRREKDFVVTQNTRICSAYSEGGVKTDDNQYPTVFPLRPSIPLKKQKPPTPRDEDPVYTKRKYTKYTAHSRIRESSVLHNYEMLSANVTLRHSHMSSLKA